MSREILFKAKRKDNEEWTEGNLIQLEADYFTGNNDSERTYCIFPARKNAICPVKNFKPEFARKGYEIDPNTICQYTGFEDIEGSKAFENDIVFCEETGVTGKIVYKPGCYEIEWEGANDSLRTDPQFWFSQRRMHVIGNVFDDKEDRDD